MIDATLIVAGVKGVGKLLDTFPSFLIYITWFGIVFLVAYGLLALKSAMKDHSMKVGTKSSHKSTFAIFLTLVSLSLLNPHVYLDTVMLIGTIGSAYKGIEQNIFILGAASASFVWFFSLAYGSRVLIPLFKKPITWRFLDFFTACVMFFIAYSLYQGL